MPHSAYALEYRYGTPFGREFKKTRRLNMKIASVVFLVFFVMFVTALGAFAQPCAKDAEKFCANVKQGEGRIAQCLEEHQAELSPVCKRHRIEMKEAIKEARLACKDDIPKVCAGIPPGEGRVVECLIANKSHLSPKCKMKVLEAERKSK